MPKQKVPDIEFDFFVIGEIKELFKNNEIFINKEYQRGDIWKLSQKIELIKSIDNRYSIGVIVLFINDDKKYEILDGQQRLMTINKYLNGKIDLRNTDIQSYGELNTQDRALIDAYCVYYLKLKSHDPESKEEDIVQSFLRLQEGTPLNKAEKINAHRGVFKDAFRETRETHPLFTLLGKEKRFRWRQLAAEMLLLELETDFKHNVFPSLDLASFINVLKKYKRNISRRTITFYKGNLSIMHTGLNIILTAITPRELISFYLLVSYLRKNRAGNDNIVAELSEFAKKFMKNLYSFSIYDETPPKEMSKTLFNTYRSYKQEAKILTTPESFEKRFKIVLDEFNRMYPVISKDPKRFHDEEQKRTLFFRQKGLCCECGKQINFKVTSAHHVIAHKDGGKTDDIENAVLLHPHCHKRLEKRLIKKKNELSAI
ncbi:MAG: DUF262 domain-containing protein [Candidatus Aminicenantes bacterium]|nr:DUF262 domain-containing protein [Candidatus Aminicenantes bacterium]